MLNEDDIFKGTWCLHNDKIPDFSLMVRLPLGTNSSVHFPAIIGVDIQGRVQSATENTDFRILLRYIFFILQNYNFKYFSEKGVFYLTALAELFQNVMKR